MHSASHTDIERARQLRGTMTDAEVRLWVRLRGEQIDGHRFRRQVATGPYIVDFACMKARLLVEVDGGQNSETAARDSCPTAWIESRGFKLLRFWNIDVLRNTEGVLESIRAALLQRPS